jgi:hypothetical protein
MCREAGISNKSVLIQIARAGDEETMEEVLRRVAAGEATREELRKKQPEKKAGRPKHFTFQLKDKSLPFTFNLAFKKSSVDKKEIIEAVRAILKRLEGE